MTEQEIMESSDTKEGRERVLLSCLEVLLKLAGKGAIQNMDLEGFLGALLAHQILCSAERVKDKQAEGRKEEEKVVKALFVDGPATVQ